MDNINSAENAALEATKLLFSCIDDNQSFVFEAGAGAGKTFSLVQALHYIEKSRGEELKRSNQQVACITFTNVASNEIGRRTKYSELVYSSTIHAFCWMLIQNFQASLRNCIPTLDVKYWKEKLPDEEYPNIVDQEVTYDLGIQNISESVISLGHDDVLKIMAKFLDKSKFRQILRVRFPIIFIDEYQDTYKSLMESIISNLLSESTGPLLGFFGDYWQKIYLSGCGKIEHSLLKSISKKANFRSAKSIVAVLNTMRPDLPQEVAKIDEVGTLSVFVTSAWSGIRQNKGMWKGDLPTEDAHKYLELVRSDLQAKGWDFSDSSTKILMLTHKILAKEQGYENIANTFEYKESFTKKENDYIRFLVDVLEPALQAFQNQNYGEMFFALAGNSITINKRSDKTRILEDMDLLFELCQNHTIGKVLNYLKSNRRFILPNSIQKQEALLLDLDSVTSASRRRRLEETIKLKEIAYQEIVNLSGFLSEHSLFSTQHGVKGEEFNNVLVVLGRGYSLYNFNQMLEWAHHGIPNDKQDSFDRNRNLFYVACSRAKKNLVLLFTAEVSDSAMPTLENWFGKENVQELENLNI